MNRSLVSAVVTGSASALLLGLLSAVAAAPPAVNPQTRLEISRTGEQLQLQYTVSAPLGTVHIYAAERPEALFGPESLLFSGPVPSGGTGMLTLPDWASRGTSLFALAWDAEVPNPAPARLAWIPPGQFWLGSPEDELDREWDEGPQTLVALARGFFAGRYEVTQEEYSALISTNPSCHSDATAGLPVEQVTWEEAREYCRRLTEQESVAGRVPPGFAYRLPTEAEWEYAARSGTVTRFSFGDDPDCSRLATYGWHVGNSGGQTHPVGGLQPNAWGLYDVHGNAAEWCADLYGQYPAGRVVEPQGPVKGDFHVVRGGSYEDDPEFCRSAFRLYDWTTNRACTVGFRVVLAPAWETAFADRVEMVWIPPGTFLMGSPEWEEGRNWDEGPLNRVVLTQGFWLGKHEVTQSQYADIMSTNTSYYVTPHRPVETVSWAQAVEYCTRLTARERQAGQLLRGWEYRLPTEAEWEYAARAGSTNRFSFGDDPDFSVLPEYAWFFGDAPTHGVGAKQANAWGLFDIYGNVAEWCADWYGPYAGGRMVNPQGPTIGDVHVIRGGSYVDDGDYCRAAFRLYDAQPGRFMNVGFRVALAPPPAAVADPIDLVRIDPGRFLMGSPESEAGRDPDEGPQTEVVLSHAFWMGRYEVTQSQYEALMGSNPSYARGYRTKPVENVTWAEAVEFCVRLTDHERAAGRLPDGHEYRLPTEAEWEYVARAGSTNRFSYGEDPDYGLLEDYARYLVGPTDGVGSRLPNAWGLYDLHGNVAEWCGDVHGPYAGGTLTDPRGPQAGAWRVNRGGSWDDAGRYGRSAARGGDFPTERSPSVGFRVVLAPVPRTPVFAGLDLVWIEAGSFLMGSPDTEAGREWDEGPQTQVTLTQGFWMGRHEVTQSEFALVMQTNTSRFLGLPEQPVEQVTWAEAVEFCGRVTELERQRGELPEGYVYRLPTEAEWEYAARAGTGTRFSHGEDPGYAELAGYAWALRNAFFSTHAVGRRLPNPWGLFDLYGNVAEWCSDWYGGYLGGRVADPTGPADGDNRVMRGGSFFDDGEYCRSAYRLIDWTSERFYNVGFRVVLGRPLSAS